MEVTSNRSHATSESGNWFSQRLGCSQMDATVPDEQAHNLKDDRLMERSGIFAALFATLLLSAVLPALESGTRGQGWVQAETGIAVSGYNDVRSPGTTGTLFSLSEELEADATAFVRLRLGWTFNEKHTITLLAAPLQFNSAGALDRELHYEGTIFPAGTALKGSYRFDSYRITWRRALRGSDRFSWGLGLTGKIRSAAISVEGDGQFAEKTDLGFVPLFNFAFAWKADDRLTVIFEGDAAAAPQGRAEDVLLGIRYAVNDRFEAYGGYRLLEGGADVDEVYTFALVHYGAIGIRIHF
ncbi:hypothetical protein ACFL6T_03120 [Candidatus Zixiibacteriota bacterium]